METLGENIKKARKLAGMTQNELAKRTQLSRSYIGDIEKNRYNPSISTLHLISRATSTPVTDLMVKESPAVYGTSPVNLDTISDKVVFNGSPHDLSEEEQNILSTAIKTAMTIIEAKKK